MPTSRASTPTRPATRLSDTGTPRRSPLPKLCAAAALVMQAMAALAQTPAELQQIDRLQREEQQRQQRQFERDRSSARPPVSLQPEAAQKPVRRPAGPCHLITDIRLNGAGLLIESTRDRLLRPYLGQCLGVSDIERLMGDVTAHYVNRGYIAARVYLGPQDLSSGRLELTVVEGILKTLRIEDGGAQSISPANTFPWVSGRVLDLRDIEQGLDQVNRLASNNATMSIEPGAQPGESDVVVTNTPGNRWHLTATADTFGSKPTGRAQGSVTASLDNVMGFDDFVSVTDRRTLHPDGNRRNSVSDSVTYTIPFGWTLLSTGLSYSSYASVFRTPANLEMHSTGNAKNAYLRADRVVYRDRDNLLTLSGTVTRKESTTFLAEQRVDVSSRALTVGDLDLSLRTRAAGGVLFLGAGLSHGLRWFNALDDADHLPDTAPHAQFDKQRASASWSRQFALGGSSLDIGSQISGQYSKQVLYGSEQMSVGGVYSVRGFEDSSLANDIGWMWRNDVGLTTPMQVGSLAGSWRPYLGLDTGRVRGRHQDGDAGRLSGAALGLQLRVAKVALDTYVMAPIGGHSAFPDAKASVQASLSISF